MSDISYSNMLEMLKDCLSEVQKRAAKMKVPGISSGFGNLDGLMCGFEPGKVYVIGQQQMAEVITQELPFLPDDIENAVEAEADINDWK